MITLVSQPQDLQPTFNQMIIAVTGSFQTQPNFQFVADISVDGASQSRLKVPVNPDGYGVFDVHRHLENRLTFDFNPTWTGLNIATNSIISYDMDFAEEFRYEFEFWDNAFTTGGFLGFIGATGGSQPLFSVGDQIEVQQDPVPTNFEYNGITTITGITFSSPYWIIITSKPFLQSTPPEGGTIRLANFKLTNIETKNLFTKKYAWNGVFGFQDRINYTETTYIPNTTTPAKWVTNVPQGWEMDINERMWLLSYKTSNNQQKDLMVETNRGQFRIQSSFSTGVASNYNLRMISNAVGPWNLINGTASFQPIGPATFPIIDADTVTYSVWYRNQTLQQDTETMTFKIKRDCTRYEKIQLVFMDKLGSFIPFTFDRVNKNTKNITRTEWQQHYGKYAPAQQSWNYNTWDRGRSTLDIRVDEAFTITSNWVDQVQSNFLMELFESPEVYWINENGLTQAINLTINNIERKQTRNEQIINYTLTFVLANKDPKQRT